MLQKSKNSKHSLFIFSSIGVVLILVCLFRLQNYAFDFNFFNAFSDNSNSSKMSRAFRLWEEKLSSQNIVAINISQNKDALIKLDELKQELSQIDNVTIMDPNMVRDLSKFYYHYIPNIIDDKHQEEISRVFSDNRLKERYLSEKVSRFYSLISLNSNLLKKDPLFILSDFLKDEMSSGFKLRNGLLVYKGTGLLFVQTPTPISQKAKQKILSVFTKFKKNTSGSIVASPLLINQEVKEQVIYESNIFGLFTVALLIIIFLIFYQKVSYVLVTGLYIVLPLTVSITIISFFYNSINIISVLLAVGALGLISDYYIHSFNKLVSLFHRGKALGDYRRQLSTPLILSLVSTCFGLLIGVFGYVDLITQFCLIVIISLIITSFISLFSLPHFYITSISNYSFTKLPRFFLVFLKLSPKAMITLVLMGVLIVAFNYNKLEINNDVRSFSNSSLRSVKDEQEIRTLLSSKGGSDTLIVRGKDFNSLIRNLEFISDYIPSLYDSNLSHWLPSREKQQASIKAFCNSHVLRKDVFLRVGMSETAIRNIIGNDEKCDYSFINYKSWLNLFASSPLGLTYLGEVQDEYYSAIPLNYTQMTKIQSLGQDDRFMIFSKITDLNKRLDQFVKNSLFFIIPFVIVFSVVGLFFKRLAGLSSCIAISFLITLVNWSFLTLFFNFNIIVFLAIALVFTLSMDFCFYFYFTKNDFLEEFKPIVFSSITTFTAFGVMAFSSTSAVRVFGSTVALGMIMAIIFTPYVYSISHRKGEGDV